MDPIIKEYRTKHKKCKWCKYSEFHRVWIKYNVPDYYTCKLKDKIIHCEDWPTLCKYYKLKQEELVVPTEEYKEMIKNSTIFVGGKKYEKNDTKTNI